MGVYSWCTSDTRKSIPCCMPFGDLPETVYLLNPFGEPYEESDYEGYGEFGCHDVYDLVVDWNRKYLTPDNIPKPDRRDYPRDEDGDVYFARAMEKYQVLCKAVSEYAQGASDEYMQKTYGNVIGYADGSDWKRCLGVTIACMEEDHVKLRYPIKIVEHPIPYEEAGMSPSCPFQGCMYPDSMMEIRREVRQAFYHLETVQEAHRVSLLKKGNIIQAENHVDFDDRLKDASSRAFGSSSQTNRKQIDVERSK